tara:strand:+ start:186 stop:719 length:534 start_codon:yes stop_codon:yes gene_type:complete
MTTAFAAEQDSLVTHILIKIAKNGTKTGARTSDIKRYINSLPEYQRLSIAQWITSYAPDNKFWYEQIYLWVLESLVREWEKKNSKSFSSGSSYKNKSRSSKPRIDYQRAKQELKCEDLAQEYGVILQQKGSGLMIGICPFHNEKTPSFTIYPENNFYCFGCHKGGDSIALLKLFKNE